MALAVALADMGTEQSMTVPDRFTSEWMCGWSNGWDLNSPNSIATATPPTNTLYVFMAYYIPSGKSLPLYFFRGAGLTRRGGTIMLKGST